MYSNANMSAYAAVFADLFMQVEKEEFCPHKMHDVKKQNINRQYFIDEQ